MAHDDILHTVSSAARLVGVADNTIRSWERRGWLTAIRTATGVRLFTAADVIIAAAARRK